MSFYTSVVKSGNNILHRYIKDGKRYKDIVKEFDYELYLRSDYSNDSIDVNKLSLKKYKFDNINDMRQFIKDNGEENVYGNTDPVSQFIAKSYPDVIKLTNDYVVLNFDIEVEHGAGKIKYKPWHKIKIVNSNNEEVEMSLLELKDVKGDFNIYDEEKREYLHFDDSCYAPKQLGFPDPHLALYEVLSVSLIGTNEKVIYVFGTKEFTGSTKIENSDYVIEYKYCANEKDLLISFIQKWREISPDILTGWNIEGFDIPYIINRIARVLNKKFVNMLSPYSKYSENCVRESQKENNVYYGIMGITIYDYLNIYKKFSRDKQESYKLDWIGEVEVGHKKISYEEYDNSLMKLWEYDYNKFILYNAIDTLIVTKLDNKLKFINLAITIAHITKSDLSDALGTTKPWDNIIFNLLLLRNTQIIPFVKKEKVKEFLGAFVKKPLLGKHGWTITFDLTSLYPSIIILLNMSPETLLVREVGSDYLANAKIKEILLDNIDVINELLSDNNYADDGADEPVIPRSFRITKSFIDNKESLDYLTECKLETLLALRTKLNKIYDYFDSGHPYLHGVKTVQDNISNFIEMKTDLSFLDEMNATIAGNGSMYDKSFVGVIPEAMEYLFNYRKSLKNEMKEKKKLLQKKLEELHRLENL